MELIKSNQIIELIKLNQGMGLIQLIHDIQPLHLVGFSIATDVITINLDSIMYRVSLWGLNKKYNINS